MWDITADEYIEMAERAEKKARRFRNGEVRDGWSTSYISGNSTTYVNGKKYTVSILNDMAREEEKKAEQYRKEAKKLEKK